MEGVAFYEEYQDKKTKLVSNKTVLAVLVGRGLFYDASNGKTVGAIGYSKQCKTVEPTCIPLSYLKDTCKHITEDQARMIHPDLFTYLDSRILPHHLTMWEKAKWFAHNRPANLTKQEYQEWMQRRINDEKYRYLHPHAMPAELCGTCTGVPYSSVDEKRGMKDGADVKDEKLELQNW